MSQEDSFFELRFMRETDIPFIMASFLKGIYYGNKQNQLVDKRIFMDNYKQLAQVLINQGAVIIACLKEDQDVILGYSIVSRNAKIIHWVFVKSAWRKRGIARALVPPTPESITHYTQFNVGKPDEESADRAIKRLLSKFKSCIYNPFALEETQIEPSKTE